MLVLDKTLSGPLSLVAEMDLFKRHGVEEIFLLLPDELTTTCKNVVYVATYLLYIIHPPARQPGSFLSPPRAHHLPAPPRAWQLLIGAGT